MTPTLKPHRSTRAAVTLVLPAKNEAGVIEQALRTIPHRTLRASGFDVEVFVLDGNSEDGTPEIARRCGAIVVPDTEPGKGAALRNARPRFNGDYVVMLDADGTYAADALPRVLGPLARGEADVVIGRRRRRPGSMHPSHLLGNATLSVFASFLYGRYCPDLCTGLWGFRRDVLDALPLQSRGFGLEAELFGFVTRMRLRALEVHVDYLPRSGPPPKLSFGHDGLRIFRRMVHARFAPLPRPAPLPPPGPHPKRVPAREVHA